MHEIGLYHPRVHFPSDTWIKTAALYWTKMGRIVPSGYVPRDSETVRALRDELGFVVDIAPRWAMRDAPVLGACHEFQKFVQHNHVELRDNYPPDDSAHSWATHDEFPSGFEPWDDERGEPLVAEVADAKLAWGIRDLLVEHGLASAKPRRSVLDTSWLLMHPHLARVYMSALAEDLAQANRLRPATDDHSVFAVGTGWTEDRMHNLLLTPGESPIPSREQEYHDFRIREPDLIGMIAIQAVIPRDIEQLPVRKIIKIRNDFAHQFVAFRDTVDAIAKEVNENLDGVHDVHIARTYLEQEVQERLLAPMKELRDKLHRLKIDTATTTLTFKYQVPALASLLAGGVLAHEPLLAGGAAAAVGLLGLVKSARRQAAADRADSPVSYLMLVQDQLDARSALQRTAQQIRKITGRT
jgi:Family of unknown function (DUF6236)